MRNIPNVTYLLGAGASANALPVINELPSRLKIFKKLLEDRCVDEHQSLFLLELFNPEIKSIARELISDIEWALQELLSHSTIDTLAKRLYLISSRHNDLERLKRLLYIYFLFEQGYNDTNIRESTIKEAPDKRYDSFIATYISPKIDKLEMPGNIKIVTWNYDIQMELAFSKYLAVTDLDRVQERLQIFPNSLRSIDSFDEKSFGIVHLNGIINGVLGWNFSDDFRVDFYGLDQSKKGYLEIICQIYKKLEKEHLRYLTYSWEDPQEFSITFKEKNNLKGIASKIFANTDILVVVGYSFPIFNRSVDKELMRNLKKEIQHIYIQDTKDNVEDIKNIFINSFSDSIGLVKGRLPNIISTVNYTNQFHIPAEMNL
ncbi:MAG: hypothetical protein B7Y37_08795 [Sphingobacteriia bacterium 28-36-52]|nr:MAG: hypothetical protein B7Y37_08795 [Sphingobacteriia bacterium 28-36-52]